MACELLQCPGPAAVVGESTPGLESSQSDRSGSLASCSLSGGLDGEHDRMVLSGLLIARQHSRIVGWRRQAVGVGGLMFPYRFKPVQCFVSRATLTG